MITLSLIREMALAEELTETSLGNSICSYQIELKDTLFIITLSFGVLSITKDDELLWVEDIKLDTSNFGLESISRINEMISLVAFDKEYEHLKYIETNVKKSS